MAVNTGIVVGTFGIVTVGVVSGVIRKEPITPIIIGGYVAGLFASIVDLIPGAGMVAGGVMLLALVAVLFTDTAWLSVLFQASSAKSEPITQARTNPATGG